MYIYVCTYIICASGVLQTFSMHNEALGEESKQHQVIPSGVEAFLYPIQHEAMNCVCLDCIISHTQNAKHKHKHKHTTQVSLQLVCVNLSLSLSTMCVCVPVCVCACVCVHT
jgi:hypothetical protein